MYLMIADAHYGKRDNILSKKKIGILDAVDFAEKNGFSVRKVILLGDILDFWRRSIHSVLIENKFVIKDIWELGNDCIYCYGNHDIIVGEILEDVNVVPFWKKKGFKFSHGYEYEALIDDFPFIGIDDFVDFAKRMCWSNNFFGDLLSDLWRKFKMVSHGFGSGRNYEFKLYELDYTIGCIQKYKYVIGHFHKYSKGNNGVVLDAFLKGKYYVMDGDNERSLYEFDIFTNEYRKMCSLKYLGDENE